MKRRRPSLSAVVLLALAAVLTPGQARGQVFENLKAFGDRIVVGDPEVTSTWEGGKEGPKGVAAGDLDGDGFSDLAVSNLDGTVSLLLARAGGLSRARHLQTGTTTLRDVLIADLTGDGRNDIAAAALVDGVVVLLAGRGSGEFDPPVRIETWPGARNLAAGDFDGDGRLELAVAGSGKGFRQYRRDAEGVFQPVATLERFAASSSTPQNGLEGNIQYYSKPVYSLRAFRPRGEARDELLITHAESPEVCLLSAGANGALEVKSCITILDGPSGTFALEACPLTAPAAGGAADLITVHRDLGTIQVRTGVAGPGRFTAEVNQEIAVPGGPRHIAVSDLDGDGWNDLAVALRNFDRVLTYRNDRGRLVPSREMPVGQSPRELVPGDFNRDGQVDFAVINRVSEDVSVLPGVRGKVGFDALDQLYLVDGRVVAFDLSDFNRDGRADVIQLHQGSGDVSVRLARPDGSLAPPDFYTLGSVPADLRVQDVNNDGRNDMVAVNFGRQGIEKGSVSVRLGREDGTFDSEARYELPPLVGGSLFAVVVADFNGDGHPDLATGYADCRLSFFRGTGDGRFEIAGDHEHPFHHLFGYEIRAMAAGDFDRDGDIDLAGAIMSGEFIVVAENPGSLLESRELKLHRFGPEARNGWADPFPTLSMAPVDMNNDGDLDLVVGTGAGAVVFIGGPGIQFTALVDPLPGTVKVPSSSIDTGDLDGDGDEEIVVSCKVLSCIVILTKDANGKHLPSLIVDVPSGQFVALGDIDGDGHLDLAGTGDVLWTALSSRRARTAGPPVLEAQRERLPRLVINEILAVNNALPLPQNGGRRSDWLELYNGADHEVSLAGHKLVLQEEGEGPKEYSFPAEARLSSGAHLLLVASNDLAPYHTGFKLPGAGAVLRVLDAGGGEVDRVQYAAQQENVSYSRYRDGLTSFVFNPHPSPERPNADNGSLDPLASLLGAVPEDRGVNDPPRPISPGEGIRFYAQGKDDVFLMNLSVMARRLDMPVLPPQRVILYDDGLNMDGASQDGLFSGVLWSGLPAGGAIQFYLEATDIAGTTIQVPDGAFFTLVPRPGQMYTLALGSALPRLEISELVARNTQGLRDEAGQTADWVEIKNCSPAPVSLAGFYLADRFPASEEWLALPEDRTLAPGEHLVVFCDGNPPQGPLHAPFRMGGESGRLFLLGTTPSRGHQVIDAVGYPAQTPDMAWGRETCGGEWKSLNPTPGQENFSPPMAARGDVDRSRLLDITDPILILSGLYLGMEVSCREAMEVNQDGRTDLSDAIFLLGYLFLGGPAPAGEVACR